jgi:hypothetical protein
MLLIKITSIKTIIMGNTNQIVEENKPKKKRFKKRVKTYTHQVQNNGEVATQKERLKREEQQRILEIRKKNLEQIKEKVTNESEIKDFFIKAVKIKCK